MTQFSTGKITTVYEDIRAIQFDARSDGLREGWRRGMAEAAQIVKAMIPEGRAGWSIVEDAKQAILRALIRKED